MLAYSLKVLVASESWTTPLFEKEKRQCFSSFSFGGVALRLIRYENKVVVIIARKNVGTENILR